MKKFGSNLSFDDGLDGIFEIVDSDNGKILQLTSTHSPLKSPFRKNDVMKAHFYYEPEFLS